MGFIIIGLIVSQVLTVVWLAYLYIRLLGIEYFACEQFADIKIALDLPNKKGTRHGTVTQSRRPEFPRENEQ